MENEMINALTKNIGAELAKPIRMSFYEKERYLNKNENFKKSLKWQKQLMIDMAALSIFNQQIILPYYGCGNFYTDSKKSGVSRIRTSSLDIDKDFIGASSKVTRQFFAITNEYEIGIDHLHISNIANFVDFWIGRSKNYV